MKKIVSIVFLCFFDSLCLFAEEDRIGVKPLDDLDAVPARSAVVGPKPLNAAQKDAKVFFFDTIILQNCTVLSAKKQNQLVKPYLKKKLCLKDLNRLISSIQDAYGAAGYVLENVYFKKESFKTPKCLVCFLVEPKVQSLRLFERKKRTRHVNNLLDVNTDQVLKVTDLQCAFDILKELETNSYDFKLTTNPERTQHTADVVLDQNKKYVFGLSYDNQGSEDTGRDRYTVQGRLEDVLGMFEQWRFMHITTRKPSEDDRYSQTSLISLSIPYRRWRASFYGVFEKDKHPIGVMHAKTEQMLLGADLRYAFSKTWNSGSYLGTTIEHYSKLSYADGAQISVLSGDVTKWILWGSHYRYVLGGVVYGKLSYSQGIHASNGGMGRVFSKNFKKLNAEGSFQRFLGKRCKWTLSGEGQVGEPDLFNHEKFSLGGMSTVRGFLSTQEKADSGYFVRNELEYLLFNRYRTRFFLGYDYGHLNPSKRDRLEEKSLQSVCCGVRLNMKSVHFEMLMARPVHTIKSNRYTFLFGIKGEF